MPEEVLFSSESVRTRAEIAAYLRNVADSLEAGGEVTLNAGDQSISISPPDSAEFEVEVEREGPASGSGELSLELEIEWDEDQSGASGGGDLSIE
jgi:amphi-Trp domain-containing protein